MHRAGGDTFHFQAQYAQGFDGLLLSTGGLSNLSDASNKRLLGGVIRADFESRADAGQRERRGRPPTGGPMAGACTACITHYWSPNWRSNLRWDMPRSPRRRRIASTLTVAGVCTRNAGLNTQWGRGESLQAAANLIWSPVKNFDIGLEAEYLHLTSKLQNPSAAFVAAGAPGLTEDGFNTHLRLERTF